MPPALPTLAAALTEPMPQHDGAEDDRADHHLDQADEGLADPGAALGELGGDDADHDAGNHGNDDADVEPVGVVPRGLLGFDDDRWTVKLC